MLRGGNQRVRMSKQFNPPLDPPPIPPLAPRADVFADATLASSGGVSAVDLEPRVRRRSLPMIPVAVWPLSGSYAGDGDTYRIEVLLDVDTLRSCALLTVDFYARDGQPGTHIGACLLRSSSIVCEGSRTLIKGAGRFTFAAAAPLIEVVIERRNVFQKRAPATLRFFSMTLSAGAIYDCEFRTHSHLARGCEASPVCAVLPFARPQEPISR